LYLSVVIELSIEVVVVVVLSLTDVSESYFKI